MVQRYRGHFHWRRAGAPRRTFGVHSGGRGICYPAVGVATLLLAIPASHFFQTLITSSQQLLLSAIITRFVANYFSICGKKQIGFSISQMGWGQKETHQSNN